MTAPGNSVTQWGDLSPNALTAVQNDAARKPLLVTGLCGKPAIKFDGVNDTLSVPAINGAGTSSITVFVIAKGESVSTGVRNLIALNAGAAGFWMFQSGNPQTLWIKNGGNVNTTGSLPLTGYPYKIVEAVKEVNTRLKVYLNEAQVLNTTTNTAAFTNGAVSLGGGFSNAFFKGEIAEVIVYNAALDSTARRQVETYLYNRYAPPVNLGNDTTIASGICPVALNVNGCFTSQVWSTGATTSSINVTQSGAYWVAATDVFGRVTRDTIQVNYVDNALLNHPDTTICQGSSITLIPNLATPGNYTYLWQNNSTSPTLTASAAGNYFVRVTETSTGCSVYSDTLTLNVDNFASTVSLGPDKSLCAGNKIGLVSPATGWNSLAFNWSNGTTDSLLTVSISGTYNVTVTSAIGCVGSDNINVVISGNAPVVTFTGDTLCLGESYVPQNTSTTTDTSVINYYRWNFANGDTSLAANPVYTYNQPGTYNVVLLARTSAGCSASASRTVVVNTVPAAAFAAGTACVQNAYQFTDQSTPPAGGIIATWGWTFGDGGIAALQSPSHTYTATGTFAAQLIVTATSGCADTVTQNIQVVSTAAAPAVATLVNPLPNAQTGSTTVLFQWNASANAVRYVLQTATDTGFTANLTSVSTTGTQLSQNLTTNTWYWRVWAYNICNDSTATAFRKLVIFSPQSLPNLALWLSGDAGVVLNGSNVSGWNDQSGNGFNASQPTAIQQPTLLSDVKLLNHLPAIQFDGNDSLTGVNITGADASSLSIFIVGRGTSAAAGVHNFITMGGGLGGLWLFESGGNPQVLGIKNNGANYLTSGTGSQLPAGGYPFKLIETVKRISGTHLAYINENQVLNSSVANAVAPFAPGKYALGTGFNAYFKGEIAEILVYEQALDSNSRRSVENYLYNKYAPPVNLGPDLTAADFCPLKLTGGDRFVSQVWSTGQTADTIQVVEPGTYSVVATDLFGRISRDTIIVAFPNRHLNSTAVTICQGNSTNLFPLLSNPGNFTYTWQNNSHTPTFTANAAGTYYVTISANGCNINSDTATVTIDYFSTTASLGPDTVLCAGNQLGLTVPSGNWAGYTFNWSNSTADSLIVVSVTGPYALTVTNALGCVATDVVNVTIAGNAPVVSFTGDTLCFGTVYQPANNSVSTDTSSITAYLWRFGTGDSSLLALPAYTYNAAGVYTVRLTVRTSAGCSNSAQHIVEVRANPVAGFTAGTGCSGNALQFTDQSTAPSGSVINQWLWQFGDLSANSTQQNPLHTYGSAQTYTVSLTATAANGCSDTVQQTVTVVSSAPFPGQPVLIAPLNNAQSTSDSIVFAWNTALNAASYIITISTSPTLTVSPVTATVTGTQYGIVLPGNQTYYWQVQAVNICGQTSSSSIQTFSIFSPANLPNLALWLRADSGVVQSAQKVSQWRDMSGGLHHATQVNTAAQPTFVPSNNLLNYLPTLQFDGATGTSGDNLMGDTLTGAENSSLTFIFIAKGGTAANSGVKNFIALNDPATSLNGYWILATADKMLIKNNGTNYPTGGCGYLPSAGYPYTLLEAVKDFGNKTLLYQNETQINTNPTSGAGGSFVNGNYFIGKGYNNVNFKGEIAEMIVYRSALDSTSRRQVENYLYNKYAPPVNLGPNIVQTYSLCPVTLDASNRFVSYLWSTGETTSTIAARFSGTYSVTVVDVFGRTSSDEVNVTIPYQGNTVGDTVLCSGSSATVAVALSSSPYTVKWYNSDTSQLIVANPSVTLSNSGNYFAIMTDTNNCSFVSDTVHLQVDSFAYHSLLPTDTTVCEGNDISLVTAPYTAQTILWSNGATGSTITVTASGELSVVVQDINTCVSFDTIQVTKSWVAPLTDFSAANVCLGDTVYLNDLSTPLAPDQIKSRHWDFGDNATDSAQQIAHYYSLPGSYQVQMTVLTDSGCTGFKQKTVKVSSRPTASFIYNGPVCAGSTLSFMDNSTVIGGDVLINWDWTFNFTDQYAAQNVAYTFLNQGVVPVQLVVTSNQGCSDTIQQTVEVFAYFQADFDYSHICLGEVTQFTDQTQSFAVVGWTWDFGDGNASLSQNPQHTYTTANSYPVTLLAENAIGCVDTAIHVVTIVDPPVADFNGTVGCYSQPYQPQDITLSPSESVTSWQWTINGSHYNSQTPQHQFTDSGTYQVQLIVTTTSGCVDSVTKSVSVKSNPLADFGIYPLYGEAPATITFTNQSAGANTYQWYFGDGSLSTDENPSYTYLSNDTFTISLVAYSQYGCSDSTSRQFVVAPTTLDVAVSNVETVIKPLGDGTIEVTVNARLSNLGTRVITDIKLYATIGTGGVFTEDWSGLLYSGLTTPYTFSAKFIISADHADTYVCVEAKEVNKGETEISTGNNKQCVSLNEAIQLVGPSPNPSSDHATLGLILPKAGEVFIAVVNNLGQYVIPEQGYNLPAGRSDYEVPIESMRAGEYYIRIKYNDDKLMRKFVVRR